MDFKVGTSKVDITPNYGSPTRVWHSHKDRARINDIRHPLYARTIAFSDGKSINTVTSMEVAVQYKCHLDNIREIVRSMIPESIDNIILHNTHQHSDSFIEYEESYDIFNINDIAFDIDYIRGFAKRVASSVCLAVKNMQPAVAGYALGSVEEGIASCRRVVLDDGSLIWRGSRPSPKLRALPRGHIDPEVGVIYFTTLDNVPLGVIYNYACHPSAAGGDSPQVCSPDYPGFASDIIKRNLNCTALFLHGCSGDINPAKYIRGDSKDHDDRVADAMRMGQILSGEVLKTIGRIEVNSIDHFKVVSTRSMLPVQNESGNVQLCLDNAYKALEDWKRTGADPRTALRKYVISKKIVSGCCPVDMFALSVNNAAIGFISGELFTEYGEEIKKACGAELTLVASTCGEEPFYVPTADAFKFGGYETGYIAIEQTGETILKEITDLLALCIK